MNHQNLAPEVNRAIAQSELEEGVWLKDLKVGSLLRIRTRNTSYTLERREDGLYLSGHAKYCPEPVKTNIHGSTWGGSMLKMHFVVRGMRLEFSDPRYEGGRGVVTTSEIQEIAEVQ